MDTTFFNLRFVNSYTTLRVDGQPMIERQLEMEKQPKKKLDEILIKILQVAVDHSLQVAHFSRSLNSNLLRFGIPSTCLRKSFNEAAPQ